MYEWPLTPIVTFWRSRFYWNLENSTKEKKSKDIFALDLSKIFCTTVTKFQEAVNRIRGKTVYLLWYLYLPTTFWKRIFLERGFHKYLCILFCKWEVEHCPKHDKTSVADFEISNHDSLNFQKIVRWILMFYEDLIQIQVESEEFW